MLETDSATFPIVGIGASAGGLVAFEAFFSGMPADRDPGMAFILVQHLAPDHKSLLTDLIGRHTRMRVCEVEDGMVVQPNRTYIIPPGRDMAFLNGTLQLLEPGAPRGQRLPIDFFFRSLAQEQREKAICIVLSGTGSDGTQGLRAVKGEGGMAMVQTPESTEYDGMPRSAIATGLVDYVLEPADMPARLIAYASQAFSRTVQAAPAQPPRCEDLIGKVCILLRAQTGHDFSQYKRNTIKRRIERRMAVQQIGNLENYLRFLQEAPDEVEALFRDLLIGVTSFFRDPEAFKVLETKGIPTLFEGKPTGAAIRVWSCGCSTGEEAYSIAILLQEQMERLRKNFKLQVFATDIDSRAIEQARSGLYSPSIAADVPEEHLARWFTLETDRSAWRISKTIRDILVFSPQDLIKDPPFSKLDLIICRNLLIYLGSDLQKRLIPLFHYALNPGGILFLGSSETIGDFTELFAATDRQAKLYRRKEERRTTAPTTLSRFSPVSLQDIPDSRTPAGTARRPAPSPREITERTLLERFAPSSVLVNERCEMLYIHGNTSRHLEMPAGEPGLNILRLAREGIRRNLSIALHQAIKTRQAVARPGIMVLPVSSQPNQANLGPLFLVILQEAPGPELPAVMPVVELPSPAELPAGSADAPALIAALRQELQTKDEYLKSANEQLETSNEELKSSNEEMQSVNEELQSTNEELETSKEELQSVNEELSTVNAELQTKVSDLTRANNDMNNLLAGTGVGTIFVDFQLRIQRFTPSVTQVINLIASDLGRPVGHIVSNLRGYNNLVNDIKAVLDSLVPREVEVQTIEGSWFLLRIRPYRTLENVIEGAVITFFEISEMKQARDALCKANELLRLAALVHDASDAMIVRGLDGRILAWNPAAIRMYGWSETEALAKTISELIPEDQRSKELENQIRMSHSGSLEAIGTRRITKEGAVLDISLTATALVNGDGLMYAIATTERRLGS